MHFAFAEDLPADRDDVANIGGEFRALRVNDLPGCPAEDAVFIERAGQRWPGADFRMVFGVKGW